MDFIEELQLLSNRIRELQISVTTEDAAKHAFVLPFIKNLGYDIHDPNEVIPEYTCNIGTKKDVRIDYAVVNNGKVRMLFECKKPGANLSACTEQLRSYFQMMPEVRFAVLTDGTCYRFYSDIDNHNEMDKRPFLEIAMLDIREPLVNDLKRLTKGAFNIDEIIDAATELKYTREIKRILVEEFDKPSKDYVSIFANKLCSKGKTKAVMEQFAGRVKSACSEFINERINERLKIAMTDGDPWNADLTKRTWDLLPPYPSKEFIDYLKSSGRTLEHFKTLPVYLYGLKHGIIKEPPIKPNGDPRLEFFRQLLQRSNKLTNLFKNVSPTAGLSSIWAGGGKQGLAFAYVVRKNKARVEFVFWHSDPQLNRRRFEPLTAKKGEIEAAYGEPLEWDAKKEEQKQRYIRSTSSIGGLEDNEKWPQVQDDLADRMVRLEKALRPHLATLA